VVSFEMPKTGRKISYDNDNTGRYPVNFCLPSLYISLAVEEDCLKDMDLTFTIREDHNEEKAEFLFIGGYVESRNQARLSVTRLDGF
jgi:hypothetical protein